MCPLPCRRRTAYLGLTLGLRAVSFLLCIWGFVVLRRHVRQPEHGPMTNGAVTGAAVAAADELEALRKEETHCGDGDGGAAGAGTDPSPRNSDCYPERETRL